MKQLLVLLFTALVLIRCNNDDKTMASDPPPSSFTISPSDNQTEVSTSDFITLTFSKKMERNVVEKNFHLMSEMALVDSLCPDKGMASHGTMPMAMNNSSMMNHLDSIHSMKGTFTWRSDSLQCWFMPDSLLMPGTQYMIHLGTKMTSMMEQRMGAMGMMGRQGMSGMPDMMFHFITRAGGSPGSGHSEHHP